MSFSQRAKRPSFSNLRTRYFYRVRRFFHIRQSQESPFLFPANLMRQKACCPPIEFPDAKRFSPFGCRAYAWHRKQENETRLRNIADKDRMFFFASSPKSLAQGERFRHAKVRENVGGKMAFQGENCNFAGKSAYASGMPVEKSA